MSIHHHACPAFNRNFGRCSESLSGWCQPHQGCRACLWHQVGLSAPLHPLLPNGHPWWFRSRSATSACWKCSSWWLWSRRFFQARWLNQTGSRASRASRASRLRIKNGLAGLAPLSHMSIPVCHKYYKARVEEHTIYIYIYTQLYTYNSYIYNLFGRPYWLCVVNSGSLMNCLLFVPRKIMINVICMYNMQNHK